MDLRSDHFGYFTEEALRAQDGKKAPLKAFPGGPVIGEAIFRYDSESKTLNADLRMEDPEIAKIIGETPSCIIFRQESNGR